MRAVSAKSRRRARPAPDSSAASPGDSSSAREFLLAAAGIAFLTVLTFWQVRTFDFVNYDDYKFVVENPHVTGGFTSENVRWAWQHPYSATGGPLTWMSHMADVELFGLSAGGAHLVNLVLHALSAVILLGVFRAMTGSLWRSAFVAALFAVHPLHVESVAWIAERKDVLSGLFWFASIGGYSWYVRKPGPARYAAVAVLFALGLLSKPMVATLPFVLLLLDVWPLQRIPLTREGRTRFAALLVEKLPLIALAVVAMLLTLAAQEEIGAVSSTDVISLRMRMANAVVSYVAYLGKTIWPVGLVPYYPYPLTIPIVTVILCAAVLAALTAGALALARRAPFVAVGWFWYVGTLVPVIGIVQVGGHAMADRFTYLPLTGIFIAVVWGVEVLARWSAATRRLAAASGVLVVLLCAAAAHAQSRHWRDGLALWEHTVSVDPGNARAQSNLGVALGGRHRDEEAIRAYRAAIRVEPGVPQTHHNLGLALEAVGRRNEAIEQYAEAVRLDPDYAKAHMQLANLLVQRGSTGEAVRHYLEAIRLAPGVALTRVNLAVTLGRSGRAPEAIPHIIEAVRLEPRNAQSRYFAGVLLMEAGRRAEAEKMLEETLAIEPSHAAARAALAYLRR